MIGESMWISVNRLPSISGKAKAEGSSYRMTTTGTGVRSQIGTMKGVKDHRIITITKRGDIDLRPEIEKGVAMMITDATVHHAIDDGMMRTGPTGTHVALHTVADPWLVN